jgi:hypothetical protein
MKIIEAMKEAKDIDAKVQDLQDKVRKYCADQSHETPVYGSPEQQKAKIQEWLQGIHDSCLRAEKLRIQIQKTNLITPVTIELGGNSITKSIAEWILRRVKYANVEHGAWSVLTDRNLREGKMKTSTGEELAITVRRYYDANERDTKIEMYRSEPSIIDRTLEVINAKTDLVE